MPSNLSDRTNELFVEKQRNCSQAIFTAGSEQLGLGQVNSDTCLKIASAFGGGIARTGNVCGALTGALMVLGLKYGDNDEKADEVAGKFLNEFKSLHGSILCRELINHDLTTVEDLEQALKMEIFSKCQQFVEDVSLMLEKLL